MNDTMTVTDALSGLDQSWSAIVNKLDNTDALGAIAALASTVRKQIRPLPEGEIDRLAEQAERDARTMAPPVPGVTRNAGYTVQAMMPGHPAGNGLLESWWVACEDADRGAWVTWEAYALNGSQAGRLAYNAGHYFTGPGHLDHRALHDGYSQDNRTAALADLAIRAGLTSGVGLRIAAQVEDLARRNNLYPENNTEDRRMAARLRKWCGR